MATVKVLIIHSYVWVSCVRWVCYLFHWIHSVPSCSAIYCCLLYSGCVLDWKHVQRAEINFINVLGGMPLAGASLCLHSSIATWLINYSTHKFWSSLMLSILTWGLRSGLTPHTHAQRGYGFVHLSVCQFVSLSVSLSVMAVKNLWIWI